MFKFPQFNKIRAFSFRYAIIPLALLFLLIEFFDELHYGIQGAVLPAIRQDFGLAYTQVGLLLGLPGILNTFIEPFLMLLGDTLLRKSLVIAGGIAITISLIFIGVGNTFPLLLIAFIIGHPASGAFVSLSQASLMDINAGREPQMMARWSASGSIGNLIGPLLVAGGFAIGLGWRWNYFGLGIFCLLLVIMALPARFPQKESISGGPRDNLKRELRSLLPDLWKAIHNPGLLRWLGLLQMSDLLLDIFTGYVALYFADIIGFSNAQIGVLMSILMAAGLMSDLASISLLERIPGRKLVRITAAFSIVLYSSWLLAPWNWAKIILVILIRFTTLGWYPVLQGEAYATLPGRSGTVMALNSAAGLLGGMLVWIIGWVAEQIGLSSAMWTLLLGPIFLLSFVPRR